MKILELCFKYPPDMGGIQIFVKKLSEYFVKNGHEVTVYTTHQHDEKIIKSDNGIVVHYFPKTFNYLQAAISFSLLRYILLIKREDVDVIHLHLNFHFADIVTAIVAKIKKIPFIISYHNDPIQHTIMSKILGTSYFILFSMVTLSFADRIICTTKEYMLTSWRLYFFKNKISIIPFGINTDYFCPDSNIKKRYQILFVGRIDSSSIHRKGILFMLEAIKLTKYHIPEVQIIMAGPILDNVINLLKEKVNELDISQNITFLGMVNKSKLRNLYRESRAFILPSIDRGEAFGIPIIESLSCKTPVIVSDLPGPSSISNGYGIIVSKKNPKDISSGLIKIMLDDILYEKLQKGCREYVVHNFNFKINDDKIEKLLLDYIEKRTPSLIKK